MKLAAGIAFRFWAIAGLAFSIFFHWMEELPPFLFLAVLLITLPAFVAILVANTIIKAIPTTALAKYIFFGCTILLICLPYAFLMGNIWGDDSTQHPIRLNMPNSLLVLLSCNALAALFSYNLIIRYFGGAAKQFFIQPIQTIQSHKTKNKMNNLNDGRPQSNRIFIKGLITGVLILMLMIPTLFVMNLVEEREQRHKEVVKEVSSKWASQQTLSGPFLIVPYVETYANDSTKKYASRANASIIPTNLDVSTTLSPEMRPRSIYKVMLYKSNSNISGKFNAEIPEDFRAQNFEWGKAKLCFAISDFKGIEDEVKAKIGGKEYTFSPGIPDNSFSQTGLSTAFPITYEMLQNGIDFSMDIKLKGSEKLQYLPLAGTGKYSLSSTWPNPSFDGNALPGTREVKDSGFKADWVFNKANLPFATVVKGSDIDVSKLGFGVTLVQPADNYAKTMRSVKYAILFIGLTFALFFIIEILQKNPFHPVQYLLVGLALVIFYTLLLSISEYLNFDTSYIISALATILLISTYAKAHFNSLKTGFIFFGLLSLLYSFIFVLIRLEDTALLVGSIGLFIVLALVMFASRRIKWYGEQTPTQQLETI